MQAEAGVRGLRYRTAGEFWLWISISPLGLPGLTSIPPVPCPTSLCLFRCLLSVDLSCQAGDLTAALFPPLSTSQVSPGFMAEVFPTPLVH